VPPAAPVVHRCGPVTLLVQSFSSVPLASVLDGRVTCVTVTALSRGALLACASDRCCAPRHSSAIPATSATTATAIVLNKPVCAAPAPSALSRDAIPLNTDTALTAATISNQILRGSGLRSTISELYPLIGAQTAKSVAKSHAGAMAAGAEDFAIEVADVATLDYDGHAPG
jgi:hypothetical protein